MNKFQRLALSLLLLALTSFIVVEQGWQTCVIAEAQAQPQECSVTTDKPEYVLGEDVQIKISPTPPTVVAGFGCWLKIYTPDGAELKLIMCQGGINTYKLEAGPVLGRYRIELWWFSAASATSWVCASTYYEVIQPRNKPPVAVLKVFPQSASAGESVGFDASGSYDPDGRVIEYYFDFGDGETYGWTQSSSATHVYSSEGTYRAGVKVKDDKGAESGWSYVDVYVSARRNKPPVAYIDLIAPNPATQGQVVQFKGHGYDEDGEVVGCEWESSIDGFLSSSCSFETSKLSVGMHTIYFRVRDDRGEWSNPASLTLNVIEEQIILDEKALDFLIRYYKDKSDLFKSLADNLNSFTDVMPKINSIIEDLQELAKEYREEVMPSTPAGVAKKITLDVIKDMFGVSDLDDEATIIKATLESFSLLKKAEFVSWLYTQDAHGKIEPLINDLNTVSQYYSEVSGILEKYRGRTTMDRSDAERIRDLLAKARDKLNEIKLYRMGDLDSLIDSAKISIKPVTIQKDVEEGKSVEVWSGRLNLGKLIGAGGFIRVRIRQLSPKIGDLFHSKPSYQVVVYNEEFPNRKLSGSITWWFFDLGDTKEITWGGPDMWANLESAKLEDSIRISVTPIDLGGDFLFWSGPKEGKVEITIEFLEGGVGYLQDKSAVTYLENLRNTINREVQICLKADAMLIDNL